MSYDFEPKSALDRLTDEFLKRHDVYIPGSPGRQIVSLSGRTYGKPFVPIPSFLKEPPVSRRPSGTPCRDCGGPQTGYGRCRGCYMAAARQRFLNKNSDGGGGGCLAELLHSNIVWVGPDGGRYRVRVAPEVDLPEEPDEAFEAAREAIGAVIEEPNPQAKIRQILREHGYVVSDKPMPKKKGLIYLPYRAKVSGFYELNGTEYVQATTTGGLAVEFEIPDGLFFLEGSRIKLQTNGEKWWFFGLYKERVFPKTVDPYISLWEVIHNTDIEEFFG